MDPRYFSIAGQHFSDYSEEAARERQHRHEARQRKTSRRRFSFLRSLRAPRPAPAVCCEPATEAC